ncbi:helix-turn-helix transcriptional regulator [Curtobacterium sp. MCSS17_005]|uniref:helix-turn-helix transcriptional regulator n=1 Tax=Curtobacterium sp. MCSS17_005 TaxID=2175641 RepID=UPI0015E88E6D|nr:helix-turn-helix transcriptional regulator [Curtobacterium sp. MCSS17_005]WIB34378.1 helix-turn-helix transcriptional regulator [Curtobacterium sp. MCSS17_005]
MQATDSIVHPDTASDEPSREHPAFETHHAFNQYWAHVTAHVSFILDTHPIGTSAQARAAATQYLDAAAEVVPVELRVDATAETAAIGVRRATRFMKANLRRRVTAVDIAAAAGCSPRALQLVFQRELNTTPMRYLRGLRIAAAHAQLLADHQTPVGQLAGHWGFTNPGRFAAAYRARYGETPTATRARLEHTQEPASLNRGSDDVG